MDIIQQALDFVPLPYLNTAFSLLKFIYTSVEQVQTARQQLLVLSACVSQLLITLNAEYESGRRSLTPSTAATLNDLSKYVI
jgi:hypothetical protein